jgi:hypothetical protein
MLLGKEIGEIFPFHFHAYCKSNTKLNVIRANLDKKKWIFILQKSHKPKYMLIAGEFATVKNGYV